MKIHGVAFPVVVEEFSRYAMIVDFHRRLLGLPVRAKFQHAGMSVCSLGPVVLFGAEDPSSLDVPRQVATLNVARG